jgi:histidyl-tRNA synthetase
MNFVILFTFSFRVFKRAARINAYRLILVGSSEWQRGMVSVKNLSSGEQYEVKLDELE